MRKATVAFFTIYTFFQPAPSLPAAAIPASGIPSGIYTSAQPVTTSNTTPGRGHLLHQRRDNTDDKFKYVWRSNRRVVDGDVRGYRDGSGNSMSAAETATYAIAARRLRRGPMKARN